jgi:preprotein translocase subunit SecE
VNDYLKLGIWLVAALAVFAFLWHRGHLTRLGKYVGETREELRKCSWPSRDELKGSTMVVFLSVALLGAFTVAVDFVVNWLVKQILSI